MRCDRCAHTLLLSNLHRRDRHVLAAMSPDPSLSLTVEGNTILNDYTGHTTTAVVNDASVTTSITDDSLFGWSATSY